MPTESSAGVVDGGDPGDQVGGFDSSRPVLSVSDLTKVYGDDVRALDGISFDVEDASIVGLLGPNGAGKTTCIKSILGLTYPTEGTVTISGIDVHDDPSEAYHHVGVVLEGARNVYWRLTVRENLEFFASIAGQEPRAVRDRHTELLEQFDLLEKADVPVSDLSRGMKQKVALACTLSRDVDVAFLDEPTLGLDVESSKELCTELQRLARQHSTTFVVSSHDMDVIERICDRVIILNGGTIVTDSTVDDLLHLFQTQSYRLSIDGSMPAPARETISGAFAGVEWSGSDDNPTLEVALSGGVELRRLVDRILDADCDLGRIEPIELDLEDVFLRLTDASGEVETPGSRADAEVNRP